MGNAYKRKWDSATKKEVLGALSAFEHCYNEVAARSLAEFFYERLDDGCGNLNGEKEIDANGVNALLHKYAHIVLRRIVVEGLPPEQAFGFKRKKGKPKGNNQERDVVLAAGVVLALREGGRREEAILEVAEKYFNETDGERIVRRAYDKYKYAFEMLQSDTLCKIINDI